MNHDDGRRTEDNAALYRDAMDRLRLPEDFERRTQEAAQKQLEGERQKQADRDIWRSKPFYRRPAAQVCFALLLIVMIGAAPAFLLYGGNLAPRTGAVSQYDSNDLSMIRDGKAALHSKGFQAGAKDAGEISPKADALRGGIPEGAKMPDAGAAIPSEEAKQALEPDENTAASSAPSSPSPAPENGIALAQAPVPESDEEAAPNDPASPQSGTGAPAAESGQPDGAAPPPAVMFRSARMPAFGTELASSDGAALYFQSYATHSLMVWDGQTLSSTDVSNAESLLAANNGYYYTLENKLYYAPKGNPATVMRNLSGEALLPNGAVFTLKVFGADNKFVYLYADRGNDAEAGGNPYVFLRVSLDGLHPETLFSADGSAVGGTLAQAVFDQGAVYYALREGGLYALGAAGGEPRKLSGDLPNGPLHVYNKELIFADPSGSLRAVRVDGSGGRILVEGTVACQPAVRNGVVYYTEWGSSSVHAFNLTDGTILQVADSGSASGFSQILSASDGLFCISTDGQAFHYRERAGTFTAIA